MSSLSLLLVALHSLSSGMRPLPDADVRLCSPGFVPRCPRALPRSGGASSALDLQHLTWRLPCCLRLRCCLLEVGRRHVLDLAASHRLDHLCLLLQLWSHVSFLRNLDLFLKLFDITLTRSFQGVRVPSGTFLL